MLKTVWSGLDYAAFSAQRQALWSSAGRPPNLVDGANTQLYGTLRRFDPFAFAEIEASGDTRAAHRCHLAEAFLTHMGLLQESYKSRILVTQGVRYALSLIFKHLARSRTHQLLLPSDVYPVYAALAQEAGLVHDDYAARQHLPWARLENHFGWCLLVCDPLKPWGSRLENTQWDRLAKLAMATNSLVLVDGAYDLSLSPALRRHLDAQSPFVFLGSLSKGWLSPLCGGLVLASSEQSRSWRETFQKAAHNEQATRQAYAALCDHSSRPRQVQEVVDRSRAKMLALLDNRGIVASDSGSGYFLTTLLSPEELFSQGVLGIPPSVFGDTQDTGSVVSTLGALQLGRS